ncbi:MULTISPECIES: GntR family transcriptional regulator [Clostridium]|uniref:GntR family transcriptional regulator n=1 Tax=Clostridium faecium TaxID=2762223 RepID=A0ABR8YR51_9CLOT|nr:MULTISPECIES: GntR family transcriptional regulator [Clostridium]MBD8046735.1 GntR family transcriptional regulator [Clostridium faecium]MDU1348250.1 GntR family transcriptional regulator [Clostridium argentinense]
MKSINKESRIPLYYQLIDILIEMIEKGYISENDQLPSERELCETYNVSRSTVRQAMQELEREGYVYREHGKGTFVSPKKMKQDLLEFYSFTDEMKKLGKNPSSQVLDFKAMECNDELSKKMNLLSGEKIYVFTRLRLADNEPMMLERSYVPCKRFPGLTKEQLEKDAMYNIFTERYKTTFTCAEEIFQPVLASEEEAAVLKYKTGLPAMMIKRITYEDDMIIEYTKGIARGDKFKYHVLLKK